MNERKRLVCVFPRKNQKFGVPIEALNDYQISILKEFAKDKSEVKVFVLKKDTDKYRVIINRIAIRIESERHLIIFDNVYCGGIYGRNRVYEVLYQLDADLYKLVNGDYGHLNRLTNFQYWDDLFYSLFCIKEVN